MKTDRNSLLPGGALELALLAALWNQEPKACTVRTLYEQVGLPRGLVYTTIAKVLDRLVIKGLITREKVGHSYVYQAQVSQHTTQRSMIRALFSSIAGQDPTPAVAALVGALEDLSPDLLDTLADEIAARRRDDPDGT